MMLYVLLGLLAAFGLFCVLWVIFGFLLPGSRRCTVILLCNPSDEAAMLSRLLWLREMSLLRCKVLLSGRGIAARQRAQIRKKYHFVEFCDPEEPGE